MTELSCTYGDHRDEAIVAFLYDDGDRGAAEASAFATHLRICARCQADVAALKGVRAQLAHWAPPEPAFAVANPKSVRNPQSDWQSNPQSGLREPQAALSSSKGAIANPHWWSAIPVWAQVAAALLFLGVSAGIANLDVRYDRTGLSVRTGWSGRAGGLDGAGRAAGSDAPGGPNVALAVSSANAPWKADIAALESQFKNEIRTRPVGPPAPAVRAVSLSDAEIARRVRAIVEESEKRQQRELALRIAELYRDVNAQRQADLVKIDRTIGVVQNNVGIEVQKTRNQMDLVLRASQRQ